MVAKCSSLFVCVWGGGAVFNHDNIDFKHIVRCCLSHTFIHTEFSHRMFSSIGGRIARSVSRLSFKRKKKLSLFGKRPTNRIDSKTDLMAEEDTGNCSLYNDMFLEGQHLNMLCI